MEISDKSVYKRSFLLTTMRIGDDSRIECTSKLRVDGYTGIKYKMMIKVMWLTSAHSVMHFLIESIRIIVDLKKAHTFFHG